MASLLRKQSPRLSFADEVHYKESLSNCNLDNSFPESFIIGDKVWLNGIYPGRIQYIGEVHFGHGDDWAGLVLDEPIGKHDGSVNGHRYYYCENKKGLFTKLSKLTRVPLRAQESPDSGITYSPTHSNRQRHFSSPSPILKNSPNRLSSQNINQTFTPKKITPKRISISPIDRSYEYYYESDHKNTSRDRHLNQLNNSKEFSDYERNSPYLKMSPSSASSLNLNYFRTSRSSTPINRQNYRSQSIGSREPRIHHIKIELEKDDNNNKNEFKIPLKKSCSEELIEKPVLKLGDFVYVDSSKGLLPGKLRYLGPTDFKEGHWAGVELELPYGKHNGKVEGKRYFTCKKNHGLFAPCFKVHKANPKYFGKTQKNIRFADDV